MIRVFSFAFSASGRLDAYTFSSWRYASISRSVWARDRIPAVGDQGVAKADRLVLVEEAEAGEAAGDREAPHARGERERRRRADEVHRVVVIELDEGLVVARDLEAACARERLDVGN